MSRNRERLRRVIGFALLPVFGVVTPLIALPAITAQFGVSGWTAIAVGQASGAMAATVLELGWGWNGPMRVARAGARARRTHLVWALASRGVVLPLAAGGAFIVAFAIAPALRLESALVGLGASFMGMSAVWFFTGTGRPWLAVLTDAAPRALGVSLAAAGIAWFGAPLILYPLIGLCLPAVLTVLLPLVAAGVQRADLRGIRLRRLFFILTAQRHVVSARAISSTYMQLPTLLVTAVAPLLQAATFAAGDRLARMALAGLSAVPNIFQRWVGAADSRATRVARARTATLVNVAIGLAAGAVFAAFAPVAAQIVFSGTVDLSFLDAVILGLTILIVCSSRSTGGIWLAATRRSGGLLASAVAGAVVGVIAVPSLASLYGASGGFVGVALAEMAVLVAQLVAARNRRSE